MTYSYKTIYDNSRAKHEAMKISGTALYPYSLVGFWSGEEGASVNRVQLASDGNYAGVLDCEDGHTPTAVYTDGQFVKMIWHMPGVNCKIKIVDPAATIRAGAYFALTGATAGYAKYYDYADKTNVSGIQFFFRSNNGAVNGSTTDEVMML